MMDLPLLVDKVRDEMKKHYTSDPANVWKEAFIAISVADGGLRWLDGADEEKMAEWIQQFRRTKNIEAVLVARMMVKRSTILGGDGEPLIKEKAILVTGRSFSTGRTVVSITPTSEHRDYRSEEQIDKSTALRNPGLSSPDTTKVIKGNYGETKGFMQGQFKEEQRFDSSKGETAMLDPLIEGLVYTPKVEGV